MEFLTKVYILTSTVGVLIFIAGVLYSKPLCITGMVLILTTATLYVFQQPTIHTDKPKKAYVVYERGPDTPWEKSDKDYQDTTIMDTIKYYDTTKLKWTYRLQETEYARIPDHE